MTAPLTGDRTRYEPGTLGAATLRGVRPSPSLIGFRLRRGLKRQAAPIILITLFIAVIGAAYDVSGGVRPVAAAAFWAPMGLAVGLGFAIIAEFSRNTVTSLSSFGKHRGYAILGAAPELQQRTLRQLRPDQRSPQGCVTFQPASPFATAFRDLQGTLPNGVVSFIAALPDEGATTAALCTALSAAQQDRRVIVLDCDLRRRALSRSLGADVEDGLLEACANPQRWRDYLCEEDETGLHFIPAARGFNPWRTLTGVPGFAALLEAISAEYDLVVLDCPPALSSAEGPALANFARTCIVVTAWDRTPIGAVRNAMRSLRRQNLTTGVYVNRVPPTYRFGRLRPD